MSVKVGVRVRPFNNRQKELNCKLCVDMQGVTTKLLDLQDPSKNRPFSFDYSFWSHDQFSVSPSGYFVPQTSKYADQQKVFQAVGIQILDNAWQGYHCCLFAYGQTGSGKSYSMVGYGANKGIVPISCQQIFTRIKNNQNKAKQYEVYVSMLEIYNQKVQDLLIPINKRPKQGLKIREHKTLGVYVEDLTKHFVDSYASIQAKMDQGSRNRSVAATQMNASSSRAHTIISIQFRQRQIINDKKVEKLSVIYLVDLAGSQKVGKTGATGDRLKEAAGINKSLSVLGLVISTLADKAMGKGKNIIVPYRDSCLTRILQNALGGNSKTLMICAISPATDNYDQTLSTLRYADQAKKIQNKATVNQSQTDKMIRQLTQENQKLKKFMQMFSKMGININDEATVAKLNQAKSELSYNNSVMNNYSMSKSQKIKHQQQQQKTFKNDEAYVKVDTTKPYISNLNQDPFLSRKINYSIDKQTIRIGKKNAQVKNDIQIAALGMRPLLATINKINDKFYLIPYLEEGINNDNNVYLNGELITQKIEINNNDRLKFGINSIFLIIIPGGQQKPRQNKQKQLDWQYAQEQLYLLMEKQQNLKREEQKKIKLQQQKKLLQKQQQLAQIKKRQEQSEQKIRQMKEKIENQKAQLQNRRIQEQKRHAEQLKALKLEKQIQDSKKKIKDEQNQRKAKIKQKYYFQNKLMKNLPKVIEVNLIAKQFKRNITMSVKMLLFNQDSQSSNTSQKMNIKIQVDNRQKGYKYFWDLSKFSNRYYIIKDMIQKYYETGKIPQLPENEDPFWDPPEPILIGKSFMTFKGLVYLFDNPTNLAIIGENHQCGQLKVNLIPTDEQGKINLSQQLDEQQEFQPEQLIGKPFHFNIVIQSAKIPQNLSNVYVEYGLKINQTERQTFKTQQIKQSTKTPVWNYIRTHHYDNITDEKLNYLQNTNLVFKIFGIQNLKNNQKKTEKPKIENNNGVQQPDQQQAKINDLKKQTNKIQVTDNKNQQKKTTNNININNNAIVNNGNTYIKVVNNNKVTVQNSQNNQVRKNKKQQPKPQNEKIIDKKRSQHKPKKQDNNKPKQEQKCSIF